MCISNTHTSTLHTGRNLPVIDPSYIYVIIDTAKNNLRKTEYNVSNNLVGDSWVKLKRGETAFLTVLYSCGAVSDSYVLYCNLIFYNALVRWLVQFRTLGIKY